MNKQRNIWHCFFPAVKREVCVVLVVVLYGILYSPCSAQRTRNFPTIGRVERFDARCDALLPADARIEVVCGGFKWSEGPVWVADRQSSGGGYLLFSDIPANSVMKWQEGEGVSVYLHPSGYTGLLDYGREPGSNGLALDRRGQLISCEHGDRRVSLLTAGGGKITLADRWEGRRFNSPNDLAIRDNGDIFFTDPIYGLPQGEKDAAREIDFCGVYRLEPNGKVTLQSRDISRPNGIAFAPDEKTLYVANSDGNDPRWRAFPVDDQGNLGAPRTFLDASLEPRLERGGGDGLKVDQRGNVFATGPGGVLILSAEGTLLGRIVTGERISNVAWGNDGSVLYLTSDMYVCRIQTSTQGTVHRLP